MSAQVQKLNYIGGNQGYSDYEGENPGIGLVPLRNTQARGNRPTTAAMNK